MITSILTALLVLSAIGVVAGILLALASHFFKVEENETVKAVRECLPGANCGACGFAGCDAYAEAVADGKAEANLRGVSLFHSSRRTPMIVPNYCAIR